MASRFLRLVMVTAIDQLPEGCIAHIIWLSTPIPRDAGCLSVVSRVFQSAAQSDAIWERFLPPDCLSIISGSSLRHLSKKDLYFSVSDHLVLIDNHTNVNLLSHFGLNYYFINFFICFFSFAQD